MFSDEIFTTPPSSPCKISPSIKPKQFKRKTNVIFNLNPIKKRLRFENELLPPDIHPVYQPKDNECHIEKIPVEILANIFNTIDDYKRIIDITKVCKRWKQVSKNFCNPSFNLENFSMDQKKKIKNFQLKAMFNQFPRMKEINIVNCYNIVETVYQSILACTKLETLKINTSKDLPKYFIDTITDRHKYLLDLQVKGSIDLWQRDNLPDIKLKKLWIRNNDKFFGKSIEILSKKCHQLENLSIANCPLFNFNEQNEVNEQNESRDEDIKYFSKFIENNKGLKDLSITDIKITNDVLKSIAKCQQLETLKLDNCLLITDNGIKYLKGKLPNLKHITIKKSKCTSASFNLFIDPISFPNLEDIIFNHNIRDTLENANQLYIQDLIFAIHQARKEKHEKKLDDPCYSLNDDKSKFIKKHGDKFKLNFINLKDTFIPETQYFYHRTHTGCVYTQHSLNKIKLRILF